MCNVGKNSVQWRERVSYMYTLFPLKIGTVKTAKCPSPAPLAERVGQGEVGQVIHRVTYTLWLLGLAPWLGPGGPILALAAWTGLENTLTL